jgi:hypothetical protein
MVCLQAMAKKQGSKQYRARIQGQHLVMRGGTAFIAKARSFKILVFTDESGG